MSKIFKLVYENWENGNPLPNGYNNSVALHNSYFIKPYEITDLLTRNNYEVKNIDLVDADCDSFYFICHFNKIREMISNNKWILSSRIENLIKTRNLKIVFMNLHESFDDIENDIEILHNKIIELELPEENFYILNNNSYLEDIKTKLNTRINVYTTKWLIECINSSNLKNLKIEKDKKFMFLLHNRIPKPHRISLLILLKKLNVLKDDVIDWSLLYPQMPFFTPFYNIRRSTDNPYKIFGDKRYFVDIHTKENRAIFRELIATPKLSYFEHEKNWFSDMEKHDSFKWNELKSFEQSYINIVTESHFSIKDVHMTEKTFRPFYCFQIPIFCASYNHVKKLKEQHSYLDLFEDLVDHGYDNELDDCKRLEMVALEIKRLYEMGNEIINFYEKNELRFLENKKYIENYTNNFATLNYFKSLNS